MAKKKNEQDWTKIAMVVIIAIIALQVLGVYDFKSMIGTQAAPVATPTPGPMGNPTPIIVYVTPTPIGATPTPSPTETPFMGNFYVPPPILPLILCGGEYPVCGGICANEGEVCVAHNDEGIFGFDSCECVPEAEENSCSTAGIMGSCGGNCPAGQQCTSYSTGGMSWSCGCQYNNP